MEPELYCTQKEHLLATIDGLIRELAQLQQTGQKERIFILTDLLEESLRELAVLRQAAGATLAVGRRKFQ